MAVFFRGAVKLLLRMGCCFSRFQSVSSEILRGSKNQVGLGRSAECLPAKS